MIPLSLSRIREYLGLPSGAEGMAHSISASSKTLKSGGLFAALKGTRSDGHDYVNEAFELGASACLCEREIPNPKGEIIYVPDVMKALGKIAAGYLEDHRPKLVVGITGSVGKTTTKEYCAAVLSQKYKTLKSQGNFNNHLGLPLTVFELEDHEAAIFEMGMSDFGELSYLTSIVKPDIAIITNIGMSHAERLGSRDGILKAKLEILEGLPQNGCVILNGDDRKLRALEGTTGFTEVFFGIDNCASVVRAKKLSEENENVSFRADLGEGFSIDLTCVGKHNVYNILPALTLGVIAGIPPSRIKLGVESFECSAMRLQVFTRGGITVINDCYNASPDSMSAAIDVLKGMDARGGKKLAVLGDMRELGSFSAREHTKVGSLACSVADFLLVTGCNAKHYLEGANADRIGVTAFSYDTPERLVKALRSIVRPCDIILFKASRAAKLERVIDMFFEEDAL